MIILGITHPISWNNAACILVDGQLVAMVEEERLTGSNMRLVWRRNKLSLTA